MARVTRVAPHLTFEQVKQKLHSATSIWLRERWLVIYTAMLEPRPAQAIATQLGVSRPFVAKITSLYTRIRDLAHLASKRLAPAVGGMRISPAMKKPPFSRRF